MAFLSTRLSLLASRASQDFTADDAVEKLCGAQRADLVTFSYSLSMIPKQVGYITRYQVFRLLF